MQFQLMAQEDLLEEGTAIHSSILALRIPWTEEPGGLWGHKDSDTTERLSMHTQISRSLVLPRCYHPYLFS